MKLLRRWKRARNYQRWLKVEQEESEIAHLDAVIDQREAELRTLLQQIGGIEASYPGNVRLIGLAYGSALDTKREQVRILDEKIASVRRKLIREGKV